jgi:hypothetical protein
LKTVAIFAAISAVLIGILAVVLGLLYTDAVAHEAIVISAVTAFVVQVVAFSLLRLWRGPAVIMAWGIGALVRFLVVVIYALVILRSAALPIEPALVSLALFFVVCTLIEPFLLRH